MDEKMVERASLLERLERADKKIAAKLMSETMPPTPEEIEGFKRQDNYKFSTHWGNVKTFSLYFFTLVATVWVLFFCWFLYEAGKTHFGAIARSPESSAGWLYSVFNYILTICATLFVNGLISKNKARH